jgi:DNA-binding PadR family transcriptional regulator
MMDSVYAYGGDGANDMMGFLMGLKVGANVIVGLLNDGEIYFCQKIQRTLTLGVRFSLEIKDLTYTAYRYIVKLYIRAVYDRSDDMAARRNKLLPLTETTFYILLALRRPGHGYQIMQTVEALSGGGVRIAAGTMYGALENLSKQKLIVAIPSEDPRRKTYQITEYGSEILELDLGRLKQMIHAAESGEIQP